MCGRLHGGHRRRGRTHGGRSVCDADRCSAADRYGARHRRTRRPHTRGRHSVRGGRTVRLRNAGRLQNAGRLRNAGRGGHTDVCGRRRAGRGGAVVVVRWLDDRVVDRTRGAPVCPPGRWRCLRGKSHLRHRAGRIARRGHRCLHRRVRRRSDGRPRRRAGDDAERTGAGQRLRVDDGDSAVRSPTAVGDRRRRSCPVRLDVADDHCRWIVRRVRVEQPRIADGRTCAGHDAVRRRCRPVRTDRSDPRRRRRSASGLRRRAPRRVPAR